MSDIPAGAIPIEEFNATPAPTDPPQGGPTQAVGPSTLGLPAGAIPAEDFVSDEEKYGTFGQTAIAGLEGVAKGIAGPLAPLAEKALGVKEEDIRGRAAANPWTAGIAQAGGLGLGLVTGTGEGALMEAVGKGAAELAGLSHVGQAAEAVNAARTAVKAGDMSAHVLEGANAAYDAIPLAAKIGSAAVQQAAEMAVLQSGDEVSKMILHDPESSAGAAIASIGLSAALGGVSGTLVAGAVSPLWKATVGPKLDEFLTAFNTQLTPHTVVMPEAVQNAITTLGADLHPVIKSILSGDAKALDTAQDLYRAQNKEFMQIFREAPEGIRDSVSNALGVPLDEVARFSSNESGAGVREAALDKIDKKYTPLAESLERRDAEAATIAIGDEARRDFGNNIIEQGMKKIGTDSPFYKIYEDYAQRVMAKENVGELNKLKTELYNSASYKSSGDDNAKEAYRHIRSMITDFQETQIARQARTMEKEGIEGATKSGAEMLNEHADINRNYAEYAKKMDNLTNFLGIGDFRGTGKLKTKLNDLTAEQIIKKFSTKGDAAGQAMLREELPEVAELVRQHEAKKFLAPNVHTNMGETFLDTTKLSKRVEDLMKGSPEHASFIFPPGAAEKIQAAKVITDGLAKVSGIRDSGTPGGMGHVFKHMMSTAIGAIGFIMGHNPVGSALIGAVATYLGKDMPESVKLGLLRQLSSNEPIKASAFKSMVEFMQNTRNGDNLLSKASTAVFKSGAQVLLDKNIPDQSDRDKLDKIVTKTQEQPTNLQQRLAQDETGHYLPQHQAAMAQSTSTAVQYLQGLKPKAFQPSPLDRPIEPSRIEQARYNRALDIAQSPAIVLQHVKDGTLQASDIQDLHSMYPALYEKMQQKLTNEMMSHTSKGEPVPYKTRTALSLFLGQPLDSTMQPQNIIAAQPQPQAPMQQGQGKGSPKALGKSNKTYMTPLQAAQNHHSGRE